MTKYLVEATYLVCWLGWHASFECNFVYEGLSRPLRCRQQCPNYKCSLLETSHMNKIDKPL